MCVHACVRSCVCVRARARDGVPVCVNMLVYVCIIQHPNDKSS